MKEIIIRDISHIDQAAREFAEDTVDFSVIAFYGPMGAGKTTFITALCRVLGVEDVVNSPTFTIINEYCSGDGRPIYHFDFYRIEKLQEVLDIGYQEYIYSDALSLMEWPEKIEEILPDETLKVTISVEDDGTRKMVY